jgi:large subunit ribosomal protein L1
MLWELKIMTNTSKRMKNAYEAFDRNKIYALEEAVGIVKNATKTKFDETVELALNLNLDVRKAEQALRGVVQLPNGTGKTLRVAVFAKGPKAEDAQKAGADIVGADDLADKILAGTIDFDRCIATPDMMGVVGKLGKILGPKGLMPNPKLGTVTMDVAGAVTAAKSGQIEYRTDKAGIVHAGVGKVSFDAVKLVENIHAFVDVISKIRPAGVKGTYMLKMSLSSTMGPGVKVDLATMKA